MVAAYMQVTCASVIPDFTPYVRSEQGEVWVDAAPAEVD